MSWQKKIVLWSESLAALLVSVWVGLPWVVQTLVILNAIDLIGGYIVAMQRRAASSRGLFAGIVRKLYLWLLVGAIYQLWGKAQPEVASLAAGFYALWEFKSLTEKAALLGIPIPGVLTRSMQVMQEKYSGADKNPTTGTQMGKDGAMGGATQTTDKQSEG